MRVPMRSAGTRSGRADGQRLGQTGHAFDQEVPSGHEADQYALEHRVLPGDHALHLEQGGLDHLTAVARGVEADKTALLWHDLAPSGFVDGRFGESSPQLSRVLQQTNGSLEEA